MDATFRNYKMKLDHYCDDDLTRLRCLLEADVTIETSESTKVRLKINPRFDANLQVGDDVDIEMIGHNLELISKSKVLSHRIIEVEIKNIYRSCTVSNGLGIAHIKAFGALSGNDPSDSENNEMEAEEGELFTLDELCEICNDRSVTELDGITSHQAVNVSSQTCYKYKAYKFKHLATFLKCSKL